ncbi:MAG: hypothetical protein ACPKPY_04915 [Nitrososphaeraceae archaeon]
MNKKIGMFSVLIFSIMLLLIPATHIVNAQRISSDSNENIFALPSVNIMNNKKSSTSISTYNTTETSKSSFSQPTSTSIPSSTSFGNLITSSYFEDKKMYNIIMTIH